MSLIDYMSIYYSRQVDLEDGDAGDDGSDVGDGVAETEEVTVKVEVPKKDGLFKRFAKALFRK